MSTQPSERKPNIIELTGDDAWAYFDDQVRQLMQISGEEFLRRLDNGEFPDLDDPAYPDLVYLYLMSHSVR